MFHVPEKYRVTQGRYGSTADDGNNGSFKIPHTNKRFFFCMVSDGMGWDHVSVSLQLQTKRKVYPVHRTPTWEEMCLIKDIFWDAEDTVLQIHPPKSEYVSTHPYVLHLWRSTYDEFIRPDPIQVGYQGDDFQSL